MATTQQANYNRAIHKLHEQQLSSQRSLAATLEGIRGDSIARHKRSARWLVDVVSELRVRREKELSDAIVGHASSMGKESQTRCCT